MGIVRSMTGYGRATFEAEGVSVRAEIRSVNHKYKEITVRLPKPFLFAEIPVRRLVDGVVARGRVDVYIQIELEGLEGREIHMDRELALALWREAKDMCSEFGAPLPDVSFVLKQALEVKTEVEEERFLPFITGAVEKALEELVNFRVQEGERLRQDILNKLARIDELVGKAESMAEIAVEEAKERLLERLKSLEIDDQRVAQEIAIMLDKLDVNEELVRLRSHLRSFEETLDSGSPCGRKLDFIVQEMFREANTLGVKSVNTKLTMIAVEIKDQIEKIREQVQNIE